MRGMFLAILLLAAPLGVFALTWDFAEDTTWGWAAQESPAVSIGARLTATTVRSEVADGVWCIAPARSSWLPAIQLLSPFIGEDSALFDRVTLRLRLIHHSPTEGGSQMWWFNSEHKRLYEMQESLGAGRDFLTDIRSHVFTTDWQEITIDLDQEGLVWQDSLFYFELHLWLNRHATEPEDFPDFLEVDWIQLTGTEELLLGELEPRAVVGAGSGPPGALLADPVFSPLWGGVSLVGRPDLSYGVLGDVDGDGDVDLVTSTRLHRRDQKRLTVSSNDGQGRFVPTQRILLPGTSLKLEGHDFDGDGLMDLVLREGQSTEVWHNRGAAGFEPILQLPYGVWIAGLADGDGDGDVDLVVIEPEEGWYYGNPDASYPVMLWVNDGEGGFVPGDRLVLDGYQPVLPVGQFPGEAVRLLWNLPCYLPTGPWGLSRPWATQPEPVLFFEAAVNPCAVHLLADLDGDGHVDLLGSPERDLRPVVYGATTHGLALWRLDASGVLAHHTLFDSEVFFKGMGIARDLNGDGLLDVALVDINPATGPALMVLLGQHGGAPVLEGRYPLPGKGDQVLAGDVDGDGDDDLVVLGISAEAGEGLEPGAGNDGAFVFINQGAPVTAVVAEAVQPWAFSLGANYPNPFNPATTIPLIVPAGAEDVDVSIYNVLGQPVRQVWNGALAAGEHRLGWDGRDEQGQPVAAGVYLYRLQVGEQTRIRKMVKLD